MTTATDHLIDSVAGWVNGWEYGLTRTYRKGGKTIRVHILHGSRRRAAPAHVRDSFAVAEVLTPADTWTTVADKPYGAWSVEIPPRADKANFDAYLVSLADELFERAVIILNLVEG